MESLSVFRKIFMIFLLIGILLGTYSLGISDAWYAFRIEYLIKQGKIKVVKDSARKYERDICLA